MNDIAFAALSLALFALFAVAIAAFEKV